MYSRKTTITNESGLHARPAATFVSLAKTFEATIFIQNLSQKERKLANAKSILMILAQGFTKGTPIEIRADGPDEKEAIDKLIKLIEYDLIG